MSDSAEASGDKRGADAPATPAAKRAHTAPAPESGGAKRTRPNASDVALPVREPPTWTPEEIETATKMAALRIESDAARAKFAEIERKIKALEDEKKVVRAETFYINAKIEVSAKPLSFWKIATPVGPDFFTASRPFALAVWTAMCKKAGDFEFLRASGFRPFERVERVVDRFVSADWEIEGEIDLARTIIDGATAVTVVCAEVGSADVYAAFSDESAARAAAAQVSDLALGDTIKVKIHKDVLIRLDDHVVDAYDQGDAVSAEMLLDQVREGIDNE